MGFFPTAVIFYNVFLIFYSALNPYENPGLPIDCLIFYEKICLSNVSDICHMFVNNKKSKIL